jgi:uncharacterized lipoprotein YddW (UPF0748 family)
MRAAACLGVAAVLTVSGLAGPTAAAAASPRPGPPHLALWMEPGANLRALSTPEGVAEVLDRARVAGVDAIMPEAKNAWGYVTYPSDVAPTIATSPIPHAPPQSYTSPAQWYPHDYDMLGTIIAEAHARGMRVDVAVNSFGEGYSPLQAGPAFTHPEWQATAYVATRRIVAAGGESFDLAGVDAPRGENELILYTPMNGSFPPTSRWGVDAAVEGGTVTEVRNRTAGDTDPGPVPIPRGGYVLSGHGAAAAWLLRALPVGTAVAIGPVETRMERSSAHDIFAFVSPANPEVWNYELGVIHEILTRYEVDGIILDRTRYQDLTEDFSDLSRAAFEKFIGHPVAHWPDDIYTYVPRGYGVDRRPGPLYQVWLGYRAHTIYMYTRAATRLIRSLRPRVAVGMYVGAWYSAYYEEGVNWASPDVRAPFLWIGDQWVQAGLAPLLDYLMIGLYYEPVTIWDAFRAQYNPVISVQGGAMLGLSLVHGDTALIGALLVSLYADTPSQLTRAIRMSNALMRGTMLFDLIFLTDDHLWSAVRPP